MSKFSLPYLQHECVPKSWFLDRIEHAPADLDHYILKPLFSFAGLGVNINPKKEDLDAIPVEKRSQYILQEKMHFEPVIETPYSSTLSSEIDGPSQGFALNLHPVISARGADGTHLLQNLFRFGGGIRRFGDRSSHHNVCGSGGDSFCGSYDAALVSAIGAGRPDAGIYDRELVAQAASNLSGFAGGSHNALASAAD